MIISKEVKTGVLVLVGITLLIFGFNYLKGQNLLSKSRVFYAAYDNASGLVTSAPVTINGLSVGKVTEIKFKDDNSGQLIVKMLIKNDFKFSKNSIAKIYSTGVIGGKAIGIIPAFDNAENAESHSFLKSDVEAGLADLVDTKLIPLEEKIEALVENANVLLGNLNDVFNDNMKLHLANSVKHLDGATRVFENTSHEINTIVSSNKDNLGNTLSSVNDAMKHLNQITNSLSKSTPHINTTIKKMEGTLEHFDDILMQTQEGKGSIGKLLKDDNLYKNLEGASLQLEQLLEDMKLNPKRYVHFSLFGKKQKPYSKNSSEKK